MSKADETLLTFNRGVLGRSALSRLDLKRTSMSAEEQTNFVPRAFGPMSLRPGMKFAGTIDNVVDDDVSINLPDTDPQPDPTPQPDPACVAQSSAAGTLGRLDVFFELILDKYSISYCTPMSATLSIDLSLSVSNDGAFTNGSADFLILPPDAEQYPILNTIIVPDSVIWTQAFTAAGGEFTTTVNYDISAALSEITQASEFDLTFSIYIYSLSGFSGTPPVTQPTVFDGNADVALGYTGALN